MSSHTSFELLLDRINDFEYNEGYLPKVRISMAFWQEYAHDIADLSKKGVSINVVDEIKSRNSFLLEKASEKSPEIDTLFDLKQMVDKWVGQGKGHWPVRCMSMHADIYLPIEM